MYLGFKYQKQENIKFDIQNLITSLYKNIYYRIYMELPLFKYSFKIGDQWLEKYNEVFDFYKTILPYYITQSEIKTLYKILEDWITTIRLHALIDEKKTSYEEYQVSFKFPRYTLKAIVGITQ